MINSVDPDQTAPLFASILKFVSNVRQKFVVGHFSDAFFVAL